MEVKPVALDSTVHQWALARADCAAHARVVVALGLVGHLVAGKVAADETEASAGNRGPAWIADHDSNARVAVALGLAGHLAAGPPVRQMTVAALVGHLHWAVARDSVHGSPACAGGILRAAVGSAPSSETVRARRRLAAVDFRLQDGDFGRDPQSDVHRGGAVLPTGGFGHGGPRALAARHGAHCSPGLQGGDGRFPDASHSQRGLRLPACGRLPDAARVAHRQADVRVLIGLVP